MSESDPNRPSGKPADDDAVIPVSRTDAAREDRADASGAALSGVAPSGSREEARPAREAPDASPDAASPAASGASAGATHREAPGAAAGQASAASAAPAWREAAPPRERAMNRTALIVGVVAIVIALASAIWGLQRFDRIESEVTRRLQSADQRDATFDASLKHAQDLLRDVQNRGAVLESKVAETAGLQAQLEKLYRERAEDSLDALLAEVEASLTLSSQQLSLGADPQAVVVAMEDLDSRLARQNDPRLAPVRAALQRDIEKLRAYPATDVSSLALRIDALLGALDQLPLLASLEEPTRQDSGVVRADQSPEPSAVQPSQPAQQPARAGAAGKAGEAGEAGSGGKASDKTATSGSTSPDTAETSATTSPDKTTTAPATSPDKPATSSDKPAASSDKPAAPSEKPAASSAASVNSSAATAQSQPSGVTATVHAQSAESSAEQVKTTAEASPPPQAQKAAETPAQTAAPGQTEAQAQTPPPAQTPAQAQSQAQAPASAVANGQSLPPAARGEPAHPAAAGSPEPHPPTPPSSAQEPHKTGRIAATLAALGNELRGLFSVRRVDSPDALLVSPSQSYFLRQNLRLMLLNARLALLSRNDAVYRNDLERARRWISTYYDTDQRNVVAFLAQLRQLLDTKLVLDPPRIDDSLAAVRLARTTVR